MNWTEKQHGSIKLVHYKNSREVSIRINQRFKYIVLSYERFKELREVMKEIDVE